MEALHFWGSICFTAAPHGRSIPSKYLFFEQVRYPGERRPGCWPGIRTMATRKATAFQTENALDLDRQFHGDQIFVKIWFRFVSSRCEGSIRAEARCLLMTRTLVAFHGMKIHWASRSYGTFIIERIRLTHGASIGSSMSLAEKFSLRKDGTQFFRRNHHDLSRSRFGFDSYPLDVVGFGMLPGSKLLTIVLRCAHLP